MINTENSHLMKQYSKRNKQHFRRYNLSFSETKKSMQAFYFITTTRKKIFEYFFYRLDQFNLYLCLDEIFPVTCMSVYFYKNYYFISPFLQYTTNIQNLLVLHKQNIPYWMKDKNIQEKLRILLISFMNLCLHS